ncbi:YfcZ/YiiS family protein [Echinimonas agarilytica]|uniref:YfcZ/YiiS family protein n=1 Tax=Echinimonas agarilytica TaxID=1215918 RepID=A0AA41W5R7_9GAMM|nr:DUF406 family protein [Echinimonas agarilytica]MCM2679218.1 YfcZ/YiiS family protein [Echinimonas agarilytica]
MSQNLSEKVHESQACCCVDVGSILDNSDTKASQTALCANETEAKALLEVWHKSAVKASSEPFEMTHQIDPVQDGVQLSVEFTFSCQAEALIFQLGQR